MDRARILIQVKNRQDRHMLEDWLAPMYDLITAHTNELLEERFDLAIVDGPTLKTFQPKIRARRRNEEPVLLPFLLVAYSRANSTPTRHLGKLVDDLIVRPMDETELRARVANLLRLHRLSLDLKKEHVRVLKLSVTDDVSGFNNTRYLHHNLDRFMSAPEAQAQEHTQEKNNHDNFK